MPIEQIDSIERLDYLFQMALMQPQRPGIKFGPLYRGKGVLVKLWEGEPQETKGWVFPVKCRQSSERKTPYLSVAINAEHDLFWLVALLPDPKKKIASSGTVTIDVHQLLALMLGRYVPPGHEIHHVNINSLDNRANNLAIVPTQLHSQFHSQQSLHKLEPPKDAKGSKAHQEGLNGQASTTAFRPLPGKVYGYLEVVWSSQAIARMKTERVYTPHHDWIERALEVASPKRSDRRENTRKILMAIASVAPRRAGVGQDIMPHFEPQVKKRSMVEKVLEHLVWRRVLLCDNDGLYWSPDLS